MYFKYLLYSQRFEYVSKEGRDLLERMLVINPNERITAADALNHQYFKVDPQPSTYEEIADLIRYYITE